MPSFAAVVQIFMGAYIFFSREYNLMQDNKNEIKIDKWKNKLRPEFFKKKRTLVFKLVTLINCKMSIIIRECWPYRKTLYLNLKNFIACLKNI